MAMVSIWTPMLEPRIAARWFTWPNIAFFAPVPIASALFTWWLWSSLRRWRDVPPFFAAMGLFAMCYLGLGISLFPYVVPHKLTLWETASAPQSQAFLLLGTLFLLPIILFYMGWSYWVFRGKVRADHLHH
jgi:cytochrome d ubiquinol oxidase subunit II